MSDEPQKEDWEILDLAPGAPVAEVHRAYQARKAIYAEDALATYNLLGDAEREALLARMEEAYRRIVRAASAVDGSLGAPPDRTRAASPPPVSDTDEGVRREPPGLGGRSAPAAAQRWTPVRDAPPPEAQPGAYLRAYRLARGRSVEALSTETRIRRAHIEALEAERWDALPPPVYVRGFVLQLGRALGLPDAPALAEIVLERLNAD